jgi:hypothetical protein
MSTPPRLLKKLYDVLLGSPPATRADLLAAYDKWEKDELPMALALFFMHTGKVFFMAKASDTVPLTKEVIVTALRADLRLQTHHLASALFKRAVLYSGKVSRVMLLLGAALAHDDSNALKAQLYGVVLGVWATRRTGAVRDEVDKLVLSLEWLVDSSKLVFASGKEDVLQRVAQLLPPNFASVAPFTSKEQFQKKLHETMAKHLTDAFSKELVPIAMQLGHALTLQKEPLLDLQGWPDSSEYILPFLAWIVDGAGCWDAVSAFVESFQAIDIDSWTAQHESWKSEGVGVWICACYHHERTVPAWVQLSDCSSVEKLLGPHKDPVPNLETVSTRPTSSLALRSRCTASINSRTVCSICLIRCS